MPVIGLLDTRFPDAMADRLRGFRRGLAETGYVEGDNVMILYRWAENNMDRVPELVADLVRRQVAVMQAGGNTAAIFAEASPASCRPAGLRRCALRTSIATRLGRCWRAGRCWSKSSVISRTRSAACSRTSVS